MNRADLQLLTVHAPPLFDAAQSRIRWVLKAARWPGGIAELYTNRLPETDPDHTLLLFTRKSPLDELALLHVLLNRPLWRGTWNALDRGPIDSPVPMRGLANALTNTGRVREFLLAPLISPPEHTKFERVLEAEQSALRGRVCDFDLPPELTVDYANRFVPLSISSDLLARDTLGRADLFVHSGDVLHPTGSPEDRAHLLRQMQLSLQKGTVIHASHLISIALFEFRLERTRFRYAKIESRLHDLARRMIRLDYPVDPRLRNAAFRAERMGRFRRDFGRWFYTVDEKLYFKTDEVGETDGDDLLNYLWYADQASHTFYDLGYNRKDLDIFILRQKKQLPGTGLATLASTG